MEFQYCDQCGEITQKNHAAGGSEMLCAKCSGRPASPSEPRSGLQLLEDPGFEAVPSKGSDVSAQDLELFSNDTLVMRRDRPKSTKLKLVDAREGGSTAERKPGSAVLGSTQPMRAPVDGAGGTADRWRVDCLLCGGSLSVRPVPKRSKLRCPRCHQVMVLDPSGQVSAAGSVAEPRAAGRPAVPAAPAMAAAPPPPAMPPPRAAKPAAAAPASQLRMAPPNTPTPSTATPRAAAPRMAAPGPAAPQPATPRAAAPRAANPGSVAAPVKRAAPISLGDEFNIFDAPPPGSTAQRRGSVAVAAPGTAPVAGSGIPFAIAEDDGTIPVPASGAGLASALLGDEGHPTGAIAPPTRIKTRVARPMTTVSSFTAFQWITLALLPGLCGVLAVHEVSGSLGTGLLHGLGETVADNAVRLLDWAALKLGL